MIAPGVTIRDRTFTVSIRRKLYDCVLTSPGLAFVFLSGSYTTAYNLEKQFQKIK